MNISESVRKYAETISITIDNIGLIANEYHAEKSKPLNARIADLEAEVAQLRKNDGIECALCGRDMTEAEQS